MFVLWITVLFTPFVSLTCSRALLAAAEPEDFSCSSSLCFLISACQALHWSADFGSCAREKLGSEIQPSPLPCLQPCPWARKDPCASCYLCTLCQTPALLTQGTSVSCARENREMLEQHNQAALPASLSSASAECLLSPAGPAAERGRFHGRSQRGR